jgi:hypothetical protein
MGERNSPSVAHVDYDIFPLSRAKFKSLEWRNSVTHGQLKENLISIESVRLTFSYKLYDYRLFQEIRWQLWLMYMSIVAVFLIELLMQKLIVTYGYT